MTVEKEEGEYKVLTDHFGNFTCSPLVLLSLSKQPVYQLRLANVQGHLGCVAGRQAAEVGRVGFVTY